MSFVKNISVLGRLKPLLTGANLAYLDQLLTQLTDSDSQTYNVVWSEFRAKFPTASKEHATAAWNGLNALLEVVRDQRKAGL
jgi:hypothetical protein